MVSLSYRVLGYITWLRRHRPVVAVVIVVLEALVYYLDYSISAEVPVSQLHAISIILATIIFAEIGVVILAISATSLFYVANFLAKGRTLDITVGPAVLLTFLIFITVGIAALAIVRLLTSLEQSNKALAEKLQQLQASTARIELLTAERERNRLARELHDGVAKTLFGIEYAAGALEKVLPSDSPQTAPAFQQARFIQDIAHREGQAVRDIILDLRRGYEEPLFRLIGEYLKRWQLAYNHPVYFKTGGSDADLPPSVAYEVMAILEEALENVHRHSQAQAVWVKVEASDNRNLSVEVRDNGVGLHGNLVENLKAIGYPGPLSGVEPLVDPAGGYHFGLTGMAERASWLNGQLELTAAPEGGLRVKACIPLPNRALQG